MKQFFEEVLSLPYKPNLNTYEHEKQVERLLIKHNLEYVAQPNGSQKSPDFLVTYKGKQYPIECKSSKHPKPQYNSGLPKPGVVYIFCSAKYDQTTIFFAEDILKPKKIEMYKKLRLELKEVLNKYQKHPDWQDPDRGFDYYIRDMYQQSGTFHQTDYFKHKDRSKCEQRVLNYNW